MTIKISACVRTGRQPDVDGRCVDHHSTDCVVSVEVAPPLFECVIPGFQCTHGHHVRPVRWPTIPEQRQPD